MTPTRPLLSWGLALALVLGLPGCGSGRGGSADEADAALPRTSEFLLTAQDLPDGWRDSNSQGIDYRLSVCGVDLEPAPPARATSIRFSRGPVGPFLEQHVRVYRDDQVAGVIDALRDALPGCTEYTATGTDPDSPEATFMVRPLTVPDAPEDSVAWRQVSQGDVRIVSDILLVRRGTTGITLVSYALKDTPDPAVLQAAAAALPERP